MESELRIGWISNIAIAIGGNRLSAYNRIEINQPTDKKVLHVVEGWI